jgi:formylmethanofuran dehydrogenase subunit B
MSGAERTVEHVTCLGCGCACDDIAVVVRGGRIVDARNACPLGLAWFGDGTAPEEAGARGRPATLEQALGEATRLLKGARRPLVYLGADVSCEVQRQAVAIADRLRAALDHVGATAAAGILAAQRRGRAAATLGELRQRADLVVFWGVDPSARYPRYASRYVVDARGLGAPNGRRSRTVIAVDVGASRGPDDADRRVTLARADEVDALGVMRATVPGRTGADDARFQPAAELARSLAAARYVALVVDGEPDTASGDGDRAEALVTLAQALNGPTRCALSTLRAGGNRAGAEAVLTWQTGFPFAVDFARGTPDYRPHADAAALLAAGEIDVALVIGAVASVPEPVARGLAAVGTVVIGPRASAATFAPAVAIDTGVAGIHEGGTACRMDDIALPLRPPLARARTAIDVVTALRERLTR